MNWEQWLEAAVRHKTAGEQDLPPPGAPDPGVGERRHQEDFEDEVLRLRTTKSHGMWENTRKIWFSG